MTITRKTVVLGFLLVAALVGHADEPFVGWRKVETDHFLFIYEPPDQGAVRELLSFCEEVYADVTVHLDSYPSKVRCVVRGRIDTANGLFTTPPNHIELYVTAPSGPWLGARSESWLKIVLTHELTHYVHMAYEKGLFAGLSRVFGDPVKTAIMAFIYGWPVEGITVNAETWFSSGGRGRNAFFEMYYKAPIVEGNLFSFRQAQYSASAPPPGRAYVAGYIFVDYLTRNFGSDVFTRVHKAFVKAPFLGINRALRKVTGKKGQEIFVEMTEELVERFADARLVSGGQRITPDEAGSYSPARVTDRGLYVYRSALSKAAALVRLDSDSGEEVLFRTELTDRDSFASERSGERIVFASMRQPGLHRAGWNLVSDLYLLQVDTGTVGRITDHQHVLQPALSPDGEILVAVQIRGSYSRLVEVDIASGEIRVLFEQEQVAVYHPVFSPDGKRLAFVVNARGTQDVYVAELGDGRLDETSYPLIGPDSAGDYYPSFLDERTVLFGSDRDGELALYRVRVDGSELAMVARDPVGAYAGVVTEGELVYASYSSVAGFCLKRRPVTELLALSLPVPIAEAPAAPIALAPIPEGERYLDAAPPVLWLPIPSLVPGGPNSLDWGGGVLVAGSSVTGSAFWTAQGAYHPVSRQVQLDVDFARQWGPLQAHALVEQDYGYESDVDEYRQDTLLGGDLSWVRRRVEHDTSLGASGTVGVFYRHTEADLEAFRVGGGSAGRDDLAAVAGLTISGRREGATWDVYPHPAFLARTEMAVPLPAFADPGHGPDLGAIGTAGIPSPIPHHVLRVGARATYSRWGWYRAPTPRGLFDLPARPDDGQMVSAIDYLFPIALLDRPVVGSTYLLGLAGGLHAEALGSWQFGDTDFQFDDDLYVGAEITTVVGVNMFTLPLGVGLSVRVDRRFQRAVDPAADVAFYVYLGYDSFTGSSVRSAVSADPGLGVR